MKKPTIAPPGRAPSDSSKVEGIALRRKRNSPVPKLRPIATSRRPAALKHGPIDGAQAAPEAERHGEVKAGRYEVELEGSEGVSGQGEAAESLAAARQRARRARRVPGSGVEKFPRYLRWIASGFLQGKAFVGATVEENIRLTLLGPTDV
jgi:hypothetical protein